MSSDENATILKLCHHNLSSNVRKCLLRTFNDYMDAYEEQLSDYTKPARTKKVMKRFQQKLKFIALQEDCDDLHENFYELLKKEIDYLETLLMQVIKLKLQLLSKIRTNDIDDIKTIIPDTSEFSKQILEKNAYTFFHLVPEVYQYHQTRNVINIKAIVDNVTDDVMDNFTTKSYSALFARPLEPHVVFDSQMDDLLKKSGGSEEDKRVIPKEVEDSFEEEKVEQETRKTFEPPIYKTICVDDEAEKTENPVDTGVQLKNILAKMQDDDAKSDNSDALEETLNVTKE